MAEAEEGVVICIPIWLFWLLFVAAIAGAPVWVAAGIVLVRTLVGR